MNRPEMTGHRNDWRRTVVLFGLTGLFESLAFGHLAAFTPLYLEELRVPPASVPFWTGFLSSLAFVIGLPLLPFWGVWADRFGQKLIIVRSSAVAALIYALTAASQTVWHLAAVRLLGGFVFGNTGIMMALQSEITPRERLGMAVAIVSAGPSVGMAVGPYLGGLVVYHWGIRTLLLIDAILTAAIVVALMLLLHEEERPGESHVGTRAGVIDALRSVRSPQVASLFLVVFLMAMGATLSHTYAPVLIQSVYTGEQLAPTIGAILTASGIAMAISTPLWGRLGDVRGHLRVFRLCAVVVALAIAGQALATGVWQIAAFRTVQGVFIGGLGALSMVLLALYAPPEKRSSVLNLSLLPQQLAWFLGPLGGSGLSVLSIRAPFWAGAAGLLAGWAASLRLRNPVQSLDSEVTETVQP